MTESILSFQNVLKKVKDEMTLSKATRESITIAVLEVTSRGRQVAQGLHESYVDALPKVFSTVEGALRTKPNHRRREVDLVVLYESMIIMVMPNTDTHSATAPLRRLILAIRELAPQAFYARLPIAVGIYTWDPGSGGSASDVVYRGIDALYQAKKAEPAPYKMFHFGLPAEMASCTSLWRYVPHA